MEEHVKSVACFSVVWVWQVLDVEGVEGVKMVIQANPINVPCLYMFFIAFIGYGFVWTGESPPFVDLFKGSQRKNDPTSHSQCVFFSMARCWSS